MEIAGEYKVPSPQSKVWEGLNDPLVLKRCIPGCEELSKNSGNGFAAVVTVKVGAIRAKFRGEVELSDIDPPKSYRISGRGQGGIAGFASGGARIELTENNDGSTRISYLAEADIGGKLAAVGSRVIQGVAKKYADEFFQTFSNVVSGSEQLAEKPNINEISRVRSKSTTGFTIPDWLKSGLLHAGISIIVLLIATK